MIYETMAVDNVSVSSFFVDLEIPVYLDDGSVS